MQPTKVELADADQWMAARFGDAVNSAGPPIEFTFDGRSSKELFCHWRVDRSTSADADSQAFRQAKNGDETTHLSLNDLEPAPEYLVTDLKTHHRANSAVRI